MTKSKTQKSNTKSTKVSKKPTATSLAIEFQKTGSEKAFTELYKALKPGVINYTNQFVNISPEIRQDLVEEVFTTVFLKISQYKPKYHISTWIYQIAYNHFCYHTRHAERKGDKHALLSQFTSEDGSENTDAIEFAAMDEEFTDPITDMEQETEANNQANRVNDLIAEMPADISRIMKLKYFDDLTIKEIAIRLNITENIVKNKIVNGKKFLQENF